MTQTDVAIGKDQGEKFDAGERQVLLRQHAPGGAGIGGDERVGGDIAGADIFRESAAHGIQDLRMLKVHSVI